MKGPASGKALTLTGESFIVGRADESVDWVPDLDLTPDFKVSRKHASVSFREGNWWIEEMGSRHGTLIEGRKVGQLTRLSPGELVQTGESSWILDHPDRRYLNRGELIVGYGMVSSVNYALYHCGIPLVTDLMIMNTGVGESSGLEVTISLRGYSDTWYRRIDPLPGGGRVVIKAIHLPLHYEKLEGNEGIKKARVEIRIGDDLISTEPVNILGFYQWPVNPSHRRTLACFVQPSHPLVQTITLNAGAFLEKDDSASSLHRMLKTDREDRIDLSIEALYRCMAEEYRIGYLPPPQSLEREFQAIRPPHLLIFDSRGKQGGGTCIDTTLLFASCLENVGCQPLILVVRERANCYHAILGCWRSVTERFEPIVTDFERMKEAVFGGMEGKLVVLETTGITDRFGRKLSYSQAIDLAREQLKEREFLWALDVTALRQTIPPLHLPMSPEAMEIVRAAEEQARVENSTRLETRHLLMSLLIRRNEGFLSAEHLIEGLPVRERTDNPSGRKAGNDRRGVLRPTINYRRVLEDAGLMASDIGRTYVDEQHLWYALLISQSRKVDSILESLGASRDSLRCEFELHHKWTAEVVRTHLEL